MVRVAAWYARVCRLSSGVYPHQPSSPRSFCAAGPIALRQRRHSSPDLGCHLFRLRSSIMATDQCVRSCSRPPSTGARTPSSVSVDTTAEEAQRSSCSQTTSSCIEDKPSALSDTPALPNWTLNACPRLFGQVKRCARAPLASTNPSTHQAITWLHITTPCTFQALDLLPQSIVGATSILVTASYASLL